MKFRPGSYLSPTPNEVILFYCKYLQVLWKTEEIGNPKGLAGPCERRGAQGTERLLVVCSGFGPEQPEKCLLGLVNAFVSWHTMWLGTVVEICITCDETSRRWTGIHCRARSGVEDEIPWPPPTTIPAHQSHFQSLYLVRSISEAEKTQLDSHIW